MAKHKILIVDDEKISLRMTQHILSNEYDTVCDSNGRDAIEIYKTERPNLVLSNFRMPEIDGLYPDRKTPYDLVAVKTPIGIIILTPEPSILWLRNGLKNRIMT